MLTFLSSKWATKFGLIEHAYTPLIEVLYYMTREDMSLVIVATMGIERLKQQQRNRSRYKHIISQFQQKSNDSSYVCLKCN
jgi:hypothetical protein